MNLLSFKRPLRRGTTKGRNGIHGTRQGLSLRWRTYKSERHNDRRNALSPENKTKNVTVTGMIAGDEEPIWDNNNETTFNLIRNTRGYRMIGRNVVRRWLLSYSTRAHGRDNTTPGGRRLRQTLVLSRAMIIGRVEKRTGKHSSGRSSGEKKRN